MSRLGSWLLIAFSLAGGASAALGDGAPVERAKLPFQIVRTDGSPDAVPLTQAADGRRSAPRTGLVATADDKPLPLAPPRRGTRTSPARARENSPAKALSTVISSVAVVLGLFALLVWFARRTRSRGCAALPGEVLETLGRAPLNGRQEMHLVRVGNKLLLLSVTGTAAETLTEITDPQEIDRLAGICRHDHAPGVSASLREMLTHLGNR